MEITLNEENEFLLKKVFNPVILETEHNEAVGIVMRDDGFELSYSTGEVDYFIEMKNGKITKRKQ